MISSLFQPKKSNSVHIANTASPSFQPSLSASLNKRVCASDSKDFHYLRNCSENDYSGSSLSVVSPLTLNFDTPDRASGSDLKTVGKRIF